MDKLTIPYIEGDGTGRDIWNASRNVFAEAVLKALEGRKRIEWIPLLAGPIVGPGRRSAFRRDPGANQEIRCGS